LRNEFYEEVATSSSEQSISEFLTHTHGIITMSIHSNHDSAVERCHETLDIKTFTGAHGIGANR
jgi:hypothetical protein